MYHLDEPTRGETADGRYNVVIRHLARPLEWVFRFEVVGKDAKAALLALNAPDTLSRALAEPDDEEVAA